MLLRQPFGILGYQLIEVANKQPFLRNHMKFAPEPDALECSVVRYPPRE